MSDILENTRPTAARASEIKLSLLEVNQRISAAVEASIHPTFHPLLVAVSKYKPQSDILAAYEVGHRDFGENYVNEVLEKAPALPSDIRWHFIGHLQSNKAKALAAVQNLHTLHTLTTAKLATALDKARASAPPLNVLLQVNTSGEQSKSGLPPLYVADASLDSKLSDDGLIAVARHIIMSCPNLRLTGLMTIGSLDNSLASDDLNQDFQALIRTRSILEQILKREFPHPIGGETAEASAWGDGRGSLTLSMGMSNDFEAAVRAGSGIVRVGTGIFGERTKKPQTDPNVKKAEGDK